VQGPGPAPICSCRAGFCYHSSDDALQTCGKGIKGVRYLPSNTLEPFGHARLSDWHPENYAKGSGLSRVISTYLQVLERHSTGTIWGR